LKVNHESLILRGIKHMESAAKIVARARENAQCNEKDTIRLAAEETRAQRVSEFWMPCSPAA
jgi:hypothetical protein